MHGIGVSTVTAYTAHKEWATRPPDERFASVHALTTQLAHGDCAPKSVTSRPWTVGPRQSLTICSPCAIHRADLPL